MPAVVRVSDADVRRLLTSPDGPVVRLIATKTIQVETAAKRLLSQPGTGRVYVRRRPHRRVHQASAPGHPPATDLGRLRASVTHEFRVDERGFYGVVGTDVAYGRYLELGTRRIAPRPWLRRALDTVRDGAR